MLFSVYLDVLGVCLAFGISIFSMFYFYTYARAIERHVNV